MSTTHRGFSVVELLVILATLVVVVLLLIPIFAKRDAQRRARVQANTCLNNQRQLAAAVAMYAQDWKTFLPNRKTCAWSVPLNPYTDQNTNVFDCPALPGTGNAAAPDYGLNAQLFSITLGAINTPASTLLTADLIQASRKGNYALNTPATDLDPRHSNGIIVSCVDGHVAYESLNRTTGTPAATLATRGYTFKP